MHVIRFLFACTFFLSFMQSLKSEEISQCDILPLPPPFDCPCATCGYNVCACENENEPIEYVDYTPWKHSHDPGLYCLPGTKCRYLCPNRPTGAQLYKAWAETAHTKRRFPSERTPEDWHTILMLMRIIAPLTACDFRKITAFMMGEPYGSSMKQSKTSNTEGVPKESENPPNTKEKEKNVNSDLSFLEEGKQKMPEISNEEEQNGGGVNLSFLEESKQTVGPLPQIETMSTVTSNMHTVFGGHLYLDYITRNETTTGLDGPSTFQTLFHPLFLASYQDSLLLGAAIEFRYDGTQINLDLHFAKVAYFFNDWITLEFGKLVLPLGAYPMWWEPLSEFVQAPWIRDELNPIAPDGGIGIEIQGAMPLCGLIAPYFDCATFTYDFWVNNGPSEDHGEIDFDANNIDNNNNKAFGARLALWPNPLAVLGLSFLHARWNSSTASGIYSHDRLYYNAFCTDWNWNMGDYINVKGEYLWTQYDSAPHKKVTRQGYWVEGAVFLTLLACFNQNFYCNWPCFWDSIQVGIRGEQLWSTRHGEDRNRFGMLLNYYLTESAKFQFEYDINGGAPGYRENVFGMRLYWDW